MIPKITKELILQTRKILNLNSEYLLGLHFILNLN